MMTHILQLRSRRLLTGTSSLATFILNAFSSLLPVRESFPLFRWQRKEIERQDKLSQRDARGVMREWDDFKYKKSKSPTRPDWPSFSLFMWHCKANRWAICLSSPQRGHKFSLAFGGLSCLASWYMQVLYRCLRVLSALTCVMPWETVMKTVSERNRTHTHSQIVVKRWRPGDRSPDCPSLSACCLLFHRMPCTDTNSFLRLFQLFYFPRQPWDLCIFSLRSHKYTVYSLLSFRIFSVAALSLTLSVSSDYCS